MKYTRLLSLTFFFFRALNGMTILDKSIRSNFIRFASAVNVIQINKEACVWGLPLNLSILIILSLERSLNYDMSSLLANLTIG